MTITVKQAADALATTAATAHWDDGSLLLDLDDIVLRERLAPALAAALSKDTLPRREGGSAVPPQRTSLC